MLREERELPDWLFASEQDIGGSLLRGVDTKLLQVNRQRLY